MGIWAADPDKSFLFQFIHWDCFICIAGASQASGTAGSCHPGSCLDLGMDKTSMDSGKTHLPELV